MNVFVIFTNRFFVVAAYEIKIHIQVDYPCLRKARDKKCVPVLLTSLSYDQKDVYRGRAKSILIGIGLTATLAIPIGQQHGMTAVAPDIYWRYQGLLLARQIETTGLISFTPFPESTPLINWLNNFAFEFGAPTTAAIVAIATGLSLETVHHLPIFLPAFIFGSVAFTIRITDTHRLGLALSLVAVSKFAFLSALGMAHRTAAGFGLFFALLCIVAVYRSRRRQILLIVVLFLGIIFTYKTLGITALAFISLFLILRRFFEGSPQSSIRLIATLSIIAAGYYIIILNWGPQTVLLVASKLLTVPGSGISAVTNIIQPQPDTHPILYPYVKTAFEESTYQSLSTSIYQIVAVGATASVGIVTALSLILDRVITANRKSFIFAFSGFGVIAVALSTNFAGSVAFNPGHWVLFFSPTVVLFLLQDVDSLSVPSRYVSGAKVCFVAVLIVSGLIATTTSVPTERTRIGVSSPVATAGIEWAGEHYDGRVSSDFNVLSTYYTAGASAQSETWLPRGSASTARGARQIVETYYSDPDSIPAKGFIITDRMLTVGMIHLNSLFTQANPSLKKEMAHERGWAETYDNGDAAIYTNISEPS